MRIGRTLLIIVVIAAVVGVILWRYGGVIRQSTTITYTATLGPDDVGRSYDLVLNRDSTVVVRLDWDSSTIDLKFKIIKVSEVVVIGERTGPTTATTIEKLAAGSYKINVIRYGDASVSYHLTATKQ